MLTSSNDSLTLDLVRALTEIISETNGINLSDTLELLANSDSAKSRPLVGKLATEFRNLLFQFQSDQIEIETLMNHPVAKGLFGFFKAFPVPYRDEHTHLTGALSAGFIYPRLKKLLEGPSREIYEKKIVQIYGERALPIRSEADVERLLKIKDDERFSRYLSVLMLAKLVLVDRQAHREAAYHMAKELYTKFNVGFVRLKFSFSRVTTDDAETVPGADNVSEEDVVLGLYDGFMDFKKECPVWDFVLSPSFRKESSFFDSKRFKSKRENFLAQVNQVLALLDKHPQLVPYMTDVDTVGNEQELFRKSHFMDMKIGFRKLQYRGFKIRSHHGEI